MNSARPISFILYPLALLSLLCLTATPAAARDDDSVMPPPTEVQDTPASRESTPTEEKAPNLGEELKGSTGKDQHVEIYSYQRKDGAKVEEYSVQGKVYMVKIQPPGGLPPYYLYDRTGDGNFQRLPGGYKHISPPMWVIKRF